VNDNEPSDSQQKQLADRALEPSRPRALGRLWQAVTLPFTLPRQARRLKARLQSLEAQAASLGEQQREITAALDRIDRGSEQARATVAQCDGRVRTAEATLQQMDADLRQVADTAYRDASELEALHREVRDRGAEEMHRLEACEDRLATGERTAEALQAEIDSLKRALDASSERTDVLVDRLASELEEVASLVERMLGREPLPVAAVAVPEESERAAALARVQPAVLDAFRGSEAEIRHRLERYLALLREVPPVLDLGSGRGELLLLLREAGVEASGVEADPALVAGARRRGLEVTEGDVLEELRRSDDASLGAVTAIHLFEHLPPPTLLEVLAEIRRVLRPGGTLVAECPNPHSLRVGASLYWLDPTHQHPLMPEVLEVWLRASGFSDTHLELLHPFPEEQRFTTADGAVPEPGGPDVAEVHAQLERLRARLDELINGPRDFVITAHRPVESAVDDTP
jgi:O-antigen chain-terminating methyltransferase